jgi:diadenosine tetraphosphate (Ap4A) HIT family hydrolase
MSVYGMRKWTYVNTGGKFVTARESCDICRIVSRIEEAEKDYFIAELETGYVLLSNKWQYFKGYTLFISKMHVNELHLMPPVFRKQFLFEMTVVAEAVQTAFGAEKMNCESLGNSCPHVHWHIITRYGTDPLPDKAIWNIDRSIIESVEFSSDEILSMQALLKSQITKLTAGACLMQGPMITGPCSIERQPDFMD